MIGHIFRKDVRSLYPLALIVASIHLVRALLSAMLGAYMEPAELRMIAGVLPYLSMLGVIALTAAVVHQDPLPDSSEDFLIRPIRRWDLLLAKLLFVALIVVGPVFAGDVLEALLSGFALGTSLAAAFPDALSQFLLLALPSMAIASVSRNLTELLAGGLLLVFVWIALMLVLSVTGAGRAALSGGGLEWIRPTAIAVCYLILGAVVLPIQYLRRSTFASRAIIALGGLATAMLWMFIPWTPGFALQQAVGNAAAAPITVAYAPQIGRFRQSDASPPAAMDTVNLFVPLRIEGTAASDLVVVDQAAIRIRNAEGKTLFENTVSGFGRKYAQLYPSKPTGETASPHPFLTFHQLAVPASLFARVKDVDVTVEMDYSLTVMRAQPTQVLAALGGDDLTNGRRCFSRPDDDGDEVVVGCVTIKKIPSCASVYLQHEPTGNQNPPREGCAPDYTPYPLTLSRQLVNRFTVTLPFYDPARSVSYPVNAHMLKHSRVMIVPYDAVMHASRHLTIPSVRIGNWQGET
jgi:hypothetical protein